MRYRVLVFKMEESRNIGEYAVLLNDKWYGGSTPVLMNGEATIKDLKKLYPTVNFNKVKFIDVKVEEIEE